MSVSMAMLFAGGGAVNAAVESDEGSVVTVGEALDLPASTSTQTSVDQTCVASVTKDNPDMTSTEAEADCQEVNVVTVSKSYDTPDASVKYRYWSQTKTQAVWQEKHSGKFYYDGSRVWGGTSYRGYKGYHNCNQGWAYGGYIEVITCTTYGGVSTYRIQPWDFYRTHAVLKGFPASRSRDMHINAYPSGNFYSYWNN